MSLDNIQLVEKETVGDLVFPLDEILTSNSEILNRKLSIDRAISLGNLERQKVKIIFSDTTGIKKVDTTIWAVTDKAILLKQNTVVPIHRIHKLEI
jgi:uncharacterized protein (UPF0248 family)